MRKVRPVYLLVVGIVACTEKTPSSHETTSGGAAPVVRAAPALHGTLVDGKSFDLHDLRGDRVVLVFYRSASCGLCLQQLATLARDKEAYDRLDARVVAITTDPPETNRRTAEELDLNFPIVSVDRNTLMKWGVWPPGERSPRPATFIVDEGGGIRYARVGRTAADRVSDATLVFTIRSFDSPRTGARGR